MATDWKYRNANIYSNYVSGILTYLHDYENRYYHKSKIFLSNISQAFKSIHIWCNIYTLQNTILLQLYARNILLSNVK